LAEAGLLEVGGRGLEVDRGLEGFEAGGAVFKVGIDAVTEVAAGEFAEAGFRCEVFLADAGQVNLIHRTEGAEPAQTFAGRAPAELKPVLHIIEGERFRRAEEEAVNFPDRPGQRQDGEDLGEK